MTRKKYCLYDFYERYGVVAECDNLREIRQAWTSWIAETDGECDLIILLWDENLLGYRPFYGAENAGKEKRKHESTGSL